MEEWFEYAAQFVQTCRNAKMDVEDLNERLLIVLESTNSIGWGYHDTLSEITEQYLER